MTIDLHRHHRQQLRSRPQWMQRAQRLAVAVMHSRAVRAGHQSTNHPVRPPGAQHLPVAHSHPCQRSSQRTRSKRRRGFPKRECSSTAVETLQCDAQCICCFRFGGITVLLKGPADVVVSSHRGTYCWRLSAALKEHYHYIGLFLGRTRRPPISVRCDRRAGQPTALWRPGRPCRWQHWRVCGLGQHPSVIH